MALFEPIQSLENVEDEDHKRTFKDFVKKDIDFTFFNEDEHAEEHTVDGKKALIVLEEDDLRHYNSHWEWGKKGSMDDGLYLTHTILQIRVEEYGPRPKIGKELVLDKNTNKQRTFRILQCREEEGVYRMTMERVRQG